MKKITQLMLLLSLFTVNSIKAQENYKKAIVINKINIKGDIDEAWTILSNLENLEKLVPLTIEKSTATGNGKGSIVKLQLTNGKGKIIEKVVELDNQKRSISYTMIATPLPIKDYLANFTVTKIDNNNFMVQFKASFKVQDKDRNFRINAFNSLQLELLNNLNKMLNNEKY